eukprot:1136630-Pelagomonas_calceolata.AAC.4
MCNGHELEVHNNASTTVLYMPQLGTESTQEDRDSWVPKAAGEDCNHKANTQMQRQMECSAEIGFRLKVRGY